MTETYKIIPEQINSLVKRRKLNYIIAFNSLYIIVIILIVLLFLRINHSQILRVWFVAIMFFLSYFILFLILKSMTFFYTAIYSDYILTIDDEKIIQKIETDKNRIVKGLLNKAAFSKLPQGSSIYHKRIFLKRITSIKQTKKGLLIKAVYRYEKITIPKEIERYDEIVAHLEKIISNK